MIKLKKMGRVNKYKLKSVGDKSTNKIEPLQGGCNKNLQKKRQKKIGKKIRSLGIRKQGHFKSVNTKLKSCRKSKRGFLPMRVYSNKISQSI